MSEPAGVEAVPDHNLLGKRYRCATCGLELLCLTAGSGRFSCHGEPMEIVTAAALPASD
jgi:hypothetical protein